MTTPSKSYYLDHFSDAAERRSQSQKQKDATTLIAQIQRGITACVYASRLVVHFLILTSAVNGQELQFGQLELHYCGREQLGDIRQAYMKERAY
jgi:hypothetical protein